MKTKNTMKKFENERFEFLLLINGNIICQRYFDIRDYNEDSINSMEMKELMEIVAGMGQPMFTPMGIIPNHLKRASREYLWGYYKPYEEQKTEDISRRDIHSKNDIFGFKIRIDGEVVAETQFTGNYFPPKVRYQVNIKELIPEIITEIRFYLSKKTYTDSYGEITLKYEIAPHHFELSNDIY